MLVITKRTGALAGRAHVHVVVIDVPRDLVRVVGAAAGEAGHPP